MSVPAGWISEPKLAALVDVPDSVDDRRKFHRNLTNWLSSDSKVLPKWYAGCCVPFVGPLGEWYYPPVFVPMIRRINELRAQTRDMQDWRFRLWLERFPIDIVEYCRDRSLPLLKIMSDYDVAKADYEITRKLPTPPHKLRPFFQLRRLLGRLAWNELMKWVFCIATGSRIAQSVHDPNSPPREALSKLTNISATTLSACLDGSGIEDMSIARLLEAIENADANELERARIDYKALGDLKIIRFMPSRIKHNVRAFMVAALIMLRRSPDHQGDIAEKIAIAKCHQDDIAAKIAIRKCLSSEPARFDLFPETCFCSLLSLPT